jgi:glutathione S-transferase
LADSREVAEHWLPRADRKKRAQVEAFMDWATTGMKPATGAVFSVAVFPIFKGEAPASEEEQKPKRDALRAKWAAWEALLGDRDYIVGSEVSLADLVAYYDIQQGVLMLKEDVEAYPTLAKWYHRLHDLKEVTKVNDLGTAFAKQMMPKLFE